MSTKDDTGIAWYEPLRYDMYRQIARDFWLWSRHFDTSAEEWASLSLDERIALLEDAFGPLEETP